MFNATAGPYLVAMGKPSERMERGEGRQYHLGLAPGEVADRLLLFGDAERAARSAELFDEIELHIKCREYETYTGVVEGTRVSFLATGIGPDNTEIALVELHPLLSPEAILIRCGSCGGIQPQVSVGDLVISTASERMEGVTPAYAAPEVEASAHSEVVAALAEAATTAGHSHHIGRTATFGGFFAPQGRAVEPFGSRQADVAERMAAKGVLNFEMESAVLFLLGNMAGWRTGAVCSVYANRCDGSVVGADKLDIERRCVSTGLRAILCLGGSR